MQKQGHIEIRIVGKVGQLEITPDNYDIKELIEVLQTAEKMLFPTNRKERPTIAYNIEAGSVKHIFKTSMQVIIGFNAILGQIQANDYSIDFMEYRSANALEAFQQIAQKKDISFKISTSLPNSSSISIDHSTNFKRMEDTWLETEVYLYGIITDMGGKSKSNIHLDTKEYGLLKIDADKILLANYEKNPLYKNFGIRAVGLQNMLTGALDKGKLRLLEIIDYQPTYDETYLDDLIQKARNNWADIEDTDTWLNNLRGYGA